MVGGRGNAEIGGRATPFTETPFGVVMVPLLLGVGVVVFVFVIKLWPL